MKGMLVKLFIVGLSTFAFTVAYAKDHNKNDHMKNKKMWMCETNASSSDKAADKKADDKMKKGMKSAKSAFDFAYAHCRDCTKITCTTETEKQQ